MPDQNVSELIISSDDRVVSLIAAAQTADVSLATLRRRIADGSGPRIVRVTERRVGIRVRDLKAWLDARTSPTSVAE